MWNRWAMDASCKRRNKANQIRFLCTPIHHHRCFASFWQWFVRSLWRITLAHQILSSSSVHLGLKILNLSKQLCEDEKTTDWGLYWIVSWWFYHGPLAINKSQRQRRRRQRHVYFKPDECILKPDKTLWRQKLNSFPHTELQLRAWSPFHMTGNKFELHAYVCVLTDKVFAILCWGSSQRWWVLTRGLNTWFRLINRTHIQDAAALLASVTCTLTSGGRGSDALVCALFACVCVL